MTVAWEPARFAQRRFANYADLVARIENEPAWPSVAALDRVFAAELAAANVRLVEAPKGKLELAADGTIDPLSLYEVRIVETREIPTRPHNMHDLLNALVWAAFPRCKLALTTSVAAIQRARAAGRATLPSARSRDHDRYALIDEGGIVHAADRAWIFGHAILEHAYAGELGVRGAILDVSVAEAERAAVDRAFADVLADPDRVAASLRSFSGGPVDDDLLAHPTRSSEKPR